MEYLNNVSYKDCIGKVCKSKSSGDFKILKYNDSRNVEIQFLKTGYEMVAQLGHIKNGGVKDPYSPSVFGVGAVGTKYPPSEGGRNTKWYALWCHMLERCYSDIYKKKRPTYEGCEVSENFKYYEYFYEWCQSQVGFGNLDWHLDKDLLVKGNKIYGESTCVLIPPEINNALTKTNKLRGNYPVGVHFCNTRKSFIGQINRGCGQQEYLGKFKTAEEAFLAYKTAKEDYLKTLAEKWKGSIDARAYNALMNYEVEITD